MVRAKVVVSMVACGLALAAPFGIAHAEMKIGVVNFDSLLQESPQFKVMQQTLHDEFGPREREMPQLQKDLKAKGEKYQRDSAVMGDTEKSKMEREIREGQRDWQRKETEFKDDANLRQNEEIAKLQRMILAEVKMYATAESFDLIVGQALYAKDALDVTVRVLAAMQTRAGKVVAPASKSAAPAPKPSP